MMSSAPTSNQLVAVRVRPLIKRELKANSDILWKTSEREISRISNDPQNTTTFTFEKVLGPDVNNAFVYKSVAKELVDAAIHGFNGTIFAYGQTSSGKTYTMMGSSDEPGLIKCAVKDLFRQIEESKDREFLTSMSYVEIYNEEVKDLLTGVSGLKIREAEDGSVYVEKIGQELIEHPDDVFKLMATGDKLRHVGSTNMNELSSRSHAIARLYIESKHKDDSEAGAVLVSQLNFVDLAGSERANQTGAAGQRLKEGSHINASLLALANCINKLAEKSVHIPYRDSKLTRMLQNSIGGNSKTAIICNVTPASVDETISTLRFASRAKKVSTKPVVNEVVQQSTLMRRLENRVHELEQQLAEKDRNLSKAALFKELMQQAPIPEADTKRSSRRMTWCPGPGRSAPGQSLLELSLVGEASEFRSAFKRPQPPGRFNRKRPSSILLEEDEESEGTKRLSSEILEEDEKSETEGQELQESKTEDLSRVGSLQEDKKDLEQKLRYKEELLSSAEQQAESLKADNRQLQERLEKLTAEMNETSETTDHLKEQLVSENQQVKEEIDELKARNQQLMSEIDYLRSHSESAHVLKDSNLKKQEQLEKELTELRRWKAEADETINNLKDENTQKSMKLADLQAISDSKEQEIEQLKKINSEIDEDNREKTISAQQSENEALLKAESIHSAETNSMRMENDRMEKQLAGMRENNMSEVNDLKLMIESLEAELAKIKSKSSSPSLAIEALTAENVELQKQLDEFTAVTSQAKAEKDILEKHIVELEEAGKLVEAELDALKEMNEALQTELETVRESRYSPSFETAELRAENEQLLKQVEDMNEKISQSSFEIDRLRASKLDLEVELENIKADFTTPSLDTETLRAEKDELERKIGELQMISEHAKAEIGVLKESNKELEVKLDRAQENSKPPPLDYEILKSEKEELEQQIENLKSLEADAREEAESLKEKNRELSSELDEYKLNSQIFSSSIATPANEENDYGNQKAQESEITALRERVKELEEELGAVEIASSVPSIATETLETENIDLKKKIYEITEELEQTKTAMEKLKDRNHELEEHLESMRQCVPTPEPDTLAGEELAKRIEEVTDENELVRAEVEALKEINEELEAELRSLRNSATVSSSDLEIQKCELQKQADDMRKANEFSHAEVDRITQRNQDLEAEICALKEKLLLAEESLSSAANENLQEMEALSAESTRKIEELIVCKQELEKHIQVSEESSQSEKKMLEEKLSTLLEEKIEISNQLQEKMKAQGELNDSSTQTDTNFAELEAGYKSKIKQLNEEVIDLQKGIELRDHQLHVQVECTETLRKEYDELIDFTNQEREIYACRTPGQQKEKALKNEMAQMKNEYQALVKFYEDELNSNKTRFNAASKENARLRRSIGATPSAGSPMMSGKFLSPLTEYSPAFDISLSKETMPEGFITFSESPLVESKKPIFDSNTPTSSKLPTKTKATVDASTMTSIDIKWFDIDDTILGVRKTGAVNSTLTTDDSFIPATPAKGLDNTFVSEQITEFKTGLEKAYIVIEELCTKHKTAESQIQTLQDQVREKQEELNHMKEHSRKSSGVDLVGLEKKICGSCDLSVYKCEHMTFVPSCDWRDAQEELEGQINDKQKVIDSLEAQLKSLSDKHIQELDTLKAEYEFMLEATKKQKMQLTGDTVVDHQETPPPPSIEDIISSHEKQLAELNEKYGMELNAIQERHANELGDLHSKQEGTIQTLRSEHHKELQQRDEKFALELEKVEMNCQKQIVVLESDIKNLKTQHQEEIEKLNEDYRKKITEMEVDHNLEISALKLHQAETMKEEDSEELIKKLEARFEDALNQLKEKHAEERRNMASEKEDEINKLKTQYSVEEARLIEDHQSEISELQNQITSMQVLHGQQVLELKQQHGRDMEEHTVLSQKTLEQKLKEKMKNFQDELEQQKRKHAEELSSQLTDAKDVEAKMQRIMELEKVVEEQKAINERDLLQKQEEAELMMSEALADRRKLVEQINKITAELTELKASLHQFGQEMFDIEEINFSDLRTKVNELKSGTTEAQSQPRPSCSSEQDVEILRAEIMKEAKKGYSLKLIQADKIKRENNILLKKVQRLEEELANPEGEVKAHKELQERYCKEMEKYLSELTEIDEKIQRFGEDNLGYQSWDIDSLTEKIQEFIPEPVKQSAAKQLQAASKSWIGGTRKPLPEVPANKGTLGDHMRRVQHVKMIRVESEKAGLEADILKLKQENKQIDRLKSDLFDLQQTHYKLQEEHKKINNLLNLTEQELDLFRERAAANSSNALPSAKSNSEAKASLQNSFFGPMSETTTQLKIKGLEYEVYSLKKKNAESDKTLNLLRQKYIVLKDKYLALTSNTDSTDHSTISTRSRTDLKENSISSRDQESIAPSNTSVSKVSKAHPSVTPSASTEQIPSKEAQTLDATQECGTQ